MKTISLLTKNNLLKKINLKSVFYKTSSRTFNLKDFKNDSGFSTHKEQSEKLSQNQNLKKTKQEKYDENNYDDIDDLLDNIPETPTQQNNTLYTSEITYQNYLHLSEKYIKALHSAFINISKDNPDMKVTMDDDDKCLILSVLVPKFGTYYIKRELDLKMLSLTSPLSGSLYKYTYNTATNEWINESDKHNLEELLVREFCYHSKGLLLINYY